MNSAELGQNFVRLDCPVQGLTIVVDQSPDAASEDHDMEVDQEADTDVQQTKVGEQLSVINRVQRVFTFGFDYDSAFHDQVRSKAAIEFYVFVDKWYGLLTFHLNAQLVQLVGETTLVC
jgi:hypothetical protein